jgi:hypothetical protein
MVVFAFEMTLQGLVFPEEVVRAELTGVKHVIHYVILNDEIDVFALKKCLVMVLFQVADKCGLVIENLAANLAKKGALIGPLFFLSFHKFDNLLAVIFQHVLSVIFFRSQVVLSQVITH